MTIGLDQLRDSYVRKIQDEQACYAHPCHCIQIDNAHPFDGVDVILEVGEKESTNRQQSFLVVLSGEIHAPA